MHILVTGGSGFIGTRLIENLLQDGHTVKIYDKNISKSYPDISIKGDVRDIEDLTKACQGIDLIYNLAAEHADNVTPLSLYKDVNVVKFEDVHTDDVSINGTAKSLDGSDVEIFKPEGQRNLEIMKIGRDGKQQKVTEEDDGQQDDHQFFEMII